MPHQLQTGITIPVFPLPTTVFYPGTPLPLHIFEPRYREMTADALEGKRTIGMVLLKPNWEEDYFDKPQIFSAGCVGDIQKVIKHPDGKYNFTLMGLRRFRIIKEEEGKPYRQAKIELLEEKNEQDIFEDRPNECREKLIENFRKLIGTWAQNSVSLSTGSPTNSIFPSNKSKAFLKSRMSSNAQIFFTRS
jgi:hypothetical protein